MGLAAVEFADAGNVPLDIEEGELGAPLLQWSLVFLRGACTRVGVDAGIDPYSVRERFFAALRM
ncbi:MAG: hypothetical protein FWH33_01535, partial [Oscillospiraceae bacterium]|nr:hypothetical protein [Oscillospiraceae bacterium]